MLYGGRKLVVDIASARARDLGIERYNSEIIFYLPNIYGNVGKIDYTSNIGDFLSKIVKKRVFYEFCMILVRYSIMTVKGQKSSKI